MGVPQQPYPSFTLVLSQDLSSTRLPASRFAHLGYYRPYSWSRMSRTLDLDDPLMVSLLVAGFFRCN